MQQINLTVTNSSSTASGTPTGGNYLVVHNQDASASLAFTLDGSTPVVNDNGVTLAPETSFSLGQWSASAVKLISSANSQKATLLCG